MIHEIITLKVLLHGQGEGKRGGRRRQEQQRGRVGVRGFGLGGGSRALRRVTKMPVAVPRVPYRTPQEGNWQWVEMTIRDSLWGENIGAVII